MSGEYSPLKKADVAVLEPDAAIGDADVWGAAYREGGELKAIAGLALVDPMPLAFMCVADGFNPPRHWAARAGLEFMASLTMVGGLQGVMAMCRGVKPKRFLVWLGFKETGETFNGHEVMVRWLR